MFENRDYFERGIEDDSQLGRVGKNVGKWIGFITLLTVMGYTAVHGISATLSYQAAGDFGRLTGIIGIVSVEALILSLILRWHNGAIKGTQQQVVALVALGIGALLVSLATITDSWLNSGNQLSAWMVIYLGYVLPVSPLIMAILSHVVDEISPEQTNARKMANKNLELEQMRFRAHVAHIMANMEAEKQIANASLNARTNAAKQIATHYQSDEVQNAIRASALDSLPTLLRGIGVDPAYIKDSNGNGELDLADVAAYLSEHPEDAAKFFGQYEAEQNGKPFPNAEPAVSVVHQPTVNTNLNGLPIQENGNRPLS